MSQLKKAELLTKAKQVFGIYPGAKSFHFTSDGQAFSEKSNATNHGKSLEVKDTVEITKAMTIAGTIEVPNDPAPVAADPNGAKNEFQKLGTSSEKTVKSGETGTGTEADDAEKATLAAKYETLMGKKPAANIKLETLKAKVAELEVAKAAEDDTSQAGKDAEAAASGNVDNQIEQK